MSAVITPNTLPAPEAPRTSMTSREWVIPPRPKPGRKPATDTPPTKRKAQNRAAQRAFRERRAARVGELEELLEQQKAEFTKDEDESKEKIRGLEMELQSFRSRCILLENMLERERKERIRAETEAENYKRQREQGYSRHSSISTMHSSLRPLDNRRSNPEQHIHPPILPSLEQNDTTLGCGSCSPNACICAEEAMNSVANNFTKPQEQLKRPLSPGRPTSNEKRYRSNPISSHFTPQQDEISPSSHEAMKEDCGFCKDGTYCVCADTANLATPAMTPTDTLPPIFTQTQIQTPPPSEPDQFMVMEMTADGAVKLPRRLARAKSTGGCGSKNGPGTCAQCVADPKSGLFCRLMAAKFSRENPGASGCCGGKGADGGCCKSRPPPQQQKITLPSLPSLGLSCAEAYQTLSSHKNFDKASDDIGSWLPKLRATPTQSGPSLMPVEVEAASIMSVLKDFDVRFGA